MKARLSIAFFGSSLVSSYWNGAATYYRGIIRALHEQGHDVTFYEPDAYERQSHRDIDDPPWARVVVYEPNEVALSRALRSARDADLVVKASGVGVFDELLERAVLEQRRPGTMVVFWDVDAPATLDRLFADTRDPFHALIPEYDCIFTYGGGESVVGAYRELGARACVPIYNALDETTHRPAEPDARFAGDLAFMASRLPDREARVEEFFLRPARLLPRRAFVLGGTGWEPSQLPENVRSVGHVYTHMHNAFNSSPLAVLNVNRDSMARYGFSPPTRIFEAGGAAACVITDHWDGIAVFLEPDEEILVARTGDEVAMQLEALSPERARAIGAAARKRVLAEHTYARRVIQIEATLGLLGTRRAAAN